MFNMFNGQYHKELYIYYNVPVHSIQYTIPYSALRRKCINLVLYCQCQRQPPKHLNGQWRFVLQIHNFSAQITALPRVILQTGKGDIFRVDHSDISIHSMKKTALIAGREGYN